MRLFNQSEVGVAEGNQLTLFLVQHHVDHALDRQQPVYSYHIQTLPALLSTFLLIVGLVAFLNGVGGHIGVEVMDVVILYAVGEGP